MLKNISNIGITLNKTEQKQINAGQDLIIEGSGGGQSCPTGTFMCYCNGIRRGCVSSTSICIVMCGI